MVESTRIAFRLRRILVICLGIALALATMIMLGAEIREETARVEHEVTTLAELVIECVRCRLEDLLHGQTDDQATHHFQAKSRDGVADGIDFMPATVQGAVGHLQQAR